MQIECNIATNREGKLKKTSRLLLDCYIFNQSSSTSIAINIATISVQLVSAGVLLLFKRGGGVVSTHLDFRPRAHLFISLVFSVLRILIRLLFFY
jgi:hypothetical protein